MGRLIWPGLLALVMLTGAQPTCAATFNPQRCAPIARATGDNDIRLDDDRRASGVRVRMPAPVLERVRAAAAAVASHLDSEITAELTCREVFKPIYRISGYGRLQLFVAEARFSVAGIHFFLILYDPASGAVTTAPARVFAKWTEGFGSRDSLLRRPLVTSSHLPGARPQVVFEERVHNGTVYNGVIYHYLDIGPRLQLTPALALETRVLDLADERSQYIRTVRRIGPNRLRLELYRTRGAGGRERLGNAILERPGPGHSFHVMTRRIAPGFNKNALVTFCDSSRNDDTFLRDGCGFYY